MKTKKNQPYNVNDDIITATSERIADKAIAEMPESPLVSKKHQKEKMVMELEKCFHEHFKKIENGASHIISKLMELSSHEPGLISDHIAKEIKDFGLLTDKYFKNSDEYFSQIEDNKSLKEIFGLSDETMRAFYMACAELYREKNYKEAVEAFSVLVVLDPDTYVFWFGLANSEYYCNQFEEALIAYGMAIELNPSEPLNYIFSANCYEAVHDYHNAINSIDDALHIMETDKIKYKTTISKITEQKRLIEGKLKS